MSNIPMLNTTALSSSLPSTNANSPFADLLGISDYIARAHWPDAELASIESLGAPWTQIMQKRDKLAAEIAKFCEAKKAQRIAMALPPSTFGAGRGFDRKKALANAALVATAICYRNHPRTNRLFGLLQLIEKTSDNDRGTSRISMALAAEYLTCDVDAVRDAYRELTALGLIGRREVTRGGSWEAWLLIAGQATAQAHPNWLLEDLSSVLGDERPLPHTPPLPHMTQGEHPPEGAPPSYAPPPPPPYGGALFTKDFTKVHEGAADAVPTVEAKGAQSKKGAGRRRQATQSAEPPEGLPAIEVWNEYAPGCNWVPTTQITPQFLTLVAKRVQEIRGLANWRTLAHAARDDFLCRRKPDAKGELRKRQFAIEELLHTKNGDLLCQLLNAGLASGLSADPFEALIEAEMRKPTRQRQIKLEGEEAVRTYLRAALKAPVGGARA